MIKTILIQITKQKDVRQNLSKLRQEIKLDNSKKELSDLLTNSPHELISCLDNPDAKTRKNAALLMGDLGLSTFRSPLFDYYLKETHLFVKSAYLTALKSFDCSPFIPQLKEQIELLVHTPRTTDNNKHIEAEIRALSELIILEEGTVTHTFTGFHKRFECILLTNRLHKSVTELQITKGLVQPFIAGLKVTTNDISELTAIRTYSELLFVIPSLETCVMDPIKAAKQLIDSSLLSLLESIHLESAPFYFRIGIKSSMDLDTKSALTKKLSSEIQRLSNRKLLNSTSNYEIEIRLIENKLEEFNVLVKLFTIPDSRFDYRKETIAASIKPVNAALLVELAKDYMMKDAQVLDPFCGVGTMLIERQKVVKGNTSYGIDTFAEAIRKAKINTEAAGQIIHFVNKNCLEFTHEYSFDEIFTNMPFATGHKSQDEIYEIYEAFFPKANEWLVPGGTIIMYTHNRDYALLLAPKHGYKIIEEFEIMDKEGTYLLIIK
ncbi:MAG: methyltransferase [Lachnospiraceae bacterium]